MKLNILLASALCLSCVSEAQAQNLLKQLGRQFEQQGRQILRNQGVPLRGGQGGRPQINPGQEGPRPSSVPSEGGNKSGGGGNRFEGGGGFILPGNGGGRQTNPYPGTTYPGTQPYPTSQPYPGTVYPGQSGSRIISSNNNDIPTAPVDTDQYVVIRCPKAAAGSIRYTLYSDRGNYAFTMTAGKEQRFRVRTRWIIGYNDGVQQRRYRLEGGQTYTLKKTEENRWQLYSVRAAGS